LYYHGLLMISGVWFKSTTGSRFT